MKKHILFLVSAILATTTTTAMSKSIEGKTNTDKKYQTVFMEIAPQTKECYGVEKMQCMQVREVTINAKGIIVVKNPEWTNFYEGIEGYKHKTTESVILKLKAYTIKNPPADGSNIRYVLDKYIKRTPVKVR